MHNYLFVFIICVKSLNALPTTSVWQDFKIVDRAGWGAKPPKLVEPMKNPVPFVVIHHSYQPAACNSSSECIKAMQWMQHFHQDDRGWNDIGYSFGVCGDGVAYTGRGWSSVGAHAPRYNNRSIGICLIGDWRFELPPKKQLETARNLIAYGVAMGHIQENYHLVGHRQVRSTECPGDRLYKEIQTWDHYCPNPDQCTENAIPTDISEHDNDINASLRPSNFLRCILGYIGLVFIINIILI